MAVRFKPISVKAWLALIVGIALIPPLAFSFFLLERTNRAQEEAVETLASSTVAANVDSAERQIQGMLTTMRALALSDALRSGDLRAFHAEAEKALQGSASYAIVIDRDMNVIVNTRQPYDNPNGRLSDADAIRQVLETGRPAVSNAFFGSVSKKWLYYAAIPLDRTYGRAVALAINRNAESLGGLLRMEDLRGGWNASIADSQGVVLASTFMSADTGKPFFLVGDLPKQSGGYVEKDGKAYRLLSEKSELTGWTVNLWAESTAIRRPIISTYRWLLLGGLGLIAAGLAAAWLIGRQVAKSVKMLADDADRLGQGQDVAARRFPVNELNVASKALAGAADERRKAENEIRFLMREVAHRSKNQLTVISSLAKQSAAGASSVDEFGSAFNHRIMGLARSTDLLIAGSVAGVELGELIRAQVEPFKPGPEAALTIEGPRFRMSSQAAQTVGLAIHELATNAAKHGALSDPEGALSIKWTQVGDRINLHWRETLPDEVEPPTRKGFGTRLIVRTFSGALDAEVDTRFEKHGVAYDFSIPVEKLIEGAS